MKNFHIGWIPDVRSVKHPKFKIKASAETIALAEETRDTLEAKAEKYGFDVCYSILTTDEVRAQWNKAKIDSNQKRVETLKKRNLINRNRDIPKKFVLCPKCGAKTKKLCSEMGGLQTRRCKNGHEFGWDTFGGIGQVTKTYSQFCGIL